MNKTRCQWCGEVVDPATMQSCPGCGDTLQPEALVVAELMSAERQVAGLPPLRLPPARREAQRDGRIGLWVLLAVGLVAVMPAADALASVLPAPLLACRLIAGLGYIGIAVFVLQVFGSQASTGAPHTVSGKKPHTASGKAKLVEGAAVGLAVVTKVLLAVGAVVGVLALGAIIAVAGLALLLFVACMQMSGSI